MESESGQSIDLFECKCKGDRWHTEECDTIRKCKYCQRTKDDTEKYGHTRKCESRKR